MRKKRYNWGGGIPSEDIWETIDVISIFPLLGLNHCQPIIQISKIVVYL